MCGIAGYWSVSTQATERQALAMAARIAHRGPDGAGAWADFEAGVALAHRRLAILDLSPAGHQPMVSADRRLVLVYNGEIYNHRDLRNQVEAAGWTMPWRGRSDTETLLAALQLWGVARTLPRLNGMFAFAMWDRARRVLTLARDRLGEKPLFYGASGQAFLFASELKALTAHPEWQGEVDRDVLALYLRHAYVPEPYCIYRGMAKLPPAHWLEVTKAGAGEPMCYWDMNEVVQQQRRTSSAEELVGELETRLKSAVGMRMEADVPLGAFLSGGIDSSTIVALMQAQTSRPVKTFTIGFDVAGYNEAENAKAVAEHLGTDHTELYLTSQDALNVVPELPRIWDEPFADSSQIPTLLLSRMTKQHVTVALSGDAGDELFCGYNRYGQGYDLHRRLRRLPSSLRWAAARILQALPAHAIDRAIRYLPQRLRYPALGDRLNKLGSVLAKAEGTDFYRALISQSQQPGSITLGGEEPATLLSEPNSWPPLDDFRETMMYLDTLTYLPGDILTKVDRASMAVSLEARAPFLDHELVEFAWTLPLSIKLNEGRTKWALRQVLRHHVPDVLIERPKMGFGIPIEHWLSGPLRDWAGDLLAPSRLSEQGYLKASTIQSLWSEHDGKRRRCHHHLWTILMLQAWLDDAGRS
jgi:asparagine synthase (glutamine-hydrolysing)